MNCPKCGREISFSSTNQRSLENCPFCGAQLYGLVKAQSLPHASSAEEKVQRPAGIGVIAISYAICALLIFLLGVMAVLGSMLANLALAEEPGVAPSDPTLGLFLIGIGTLVIPVVLLAAAHGLWKGKKWSKDGTVLLCGINLAIFLILLFYGVLSNIVYPSDLLSQGAVASYLLIASDLLLQVAIIRYVLSARVKNYLSK